MCSQADSARRPIGLPDRDSHLFLDCRGEANLRSYLVQRWASALLPSQPHETWAVWDIATAFTPRSLATVPIHLIVHLFSVKVFDAESHRFSLVNDVVSAFTSFC
jgi:hypothetical protein